MRIDNWARFNNLFSLLSIVISIIAISIACIRPKELEPDMFNSVVTVLSLLVALLIGWQILQIINFREEKADFEKVKENFKLDMQMHVIEAEKSRSILSNSLFTFFINQQKDYEVIKYGLDMLVLNLDNPVIIQTTLDALLEYTKAGISFNYEFEKRESQILFFNFYKVIEPIVAEDNLETLRKRITSATIRN